MEKNTDLKRKSRNLSEKKRRDQFNNLINELSQLIDPNFTSQIEEEDDDTGSCSNLAAGGGRGAQRKLDKSSVLKYAMEFLKRHANPPAQATDCDLSSQREQSGPSTENATQVLIETNYHNTSSWKPSYITDDEFAVQMLEAIDAFIIVCEVDEDARIIYSSETLTNLLDYTGTCNSLCQHDYVSLFDLIAPADKAQIKKLFAREPPRSNQGQNDTANRTKWMDSNINSLSESLIRTNQDFPSSEMGDFDYVSLMINFRTGLNLSEIKQERQRNRADGENLKMADCATQQYHVPARKSLSTESIASGYIDDLIDHQKQCQQHSKQHALGQHERRDSQDFVYAQVMDDSSATCLRGQQSIAEQQQSLMFESRREQQEHNQHEQQKRQQQSRQEADIMQVVDTKQLADDNRMSDGSNGDSSSSDGVAQVLNTSGDNNSDENSDQPSGAGSDDACDSHQSQGVVKCERSYQYRHHDNIGDSQENHNRHHDDHRQKLQHVHQRQGSDGHQYELVVLMGTFKGFEDDPLYADESNYGSYTFEEPLHPPSSPPQTSSLAKKRYFICVGKLDIPRFSYDLKIIVPPVTSGINLFLNNQFTSKHTLKWRFLWIDSKASSIIGYSPFELLGTSGYDYYHWDDLDKLVISHEGLMRDGEASSGPYRFLTKGQQWIWLQTKYTIVLKPPPGDAQRKKLRKHHSFSSSGAINRHQDSRAVEQPEATMYKDRYLIKSCSRDSVVDYGTSDYRHTTLDDYMTSEDQHQDGPLKVTNQYPYHRRSVDEGSIIYTVSTQDVHDSEPKRFKPVHDIEGVTMNPFCRLTAFKDENRFHDITVADEDQSTINRQDSPNICASDVKVLAGQDSITSSENFLSRSLDQFKFILCTHTVIGFDESDNRTGNEDVCMHNNN